MSCWGILTQAFESRNEPLKDLNGYFPFTPPAEATDWQTQREAIQNRLQVALGLLPLPTRTPLNAVIHGKRDMGEYTIEKVYFESTPGFFVTGNLYRPKNIKGKAPGVLFAHGHWKDARFLIQSPELLRKEIDTGQERFTEGGKSRFQSLCVQLARMGCIVWQWDTLSDADSIQFTPEVIHRFAKRRPEMEDSQAWGLYSPQAESHLQSVMGLQTWNALRSVDFLLSLPEIDAKRIAITGASGGGTQTLMVGALDDRIALSFPAVMVSTAMQGGCSCENASLLRIGQGNVHFAALFAPKPLGMTTANDWTKEMSTKGFPELQKLYAALGEPHHVMLHRDETSPHNYNLAARTAFYHWINQHFTLGLSTPIAERDYTVLDKTALSVWDDAHPAPTAGSADFERQLLQWFQKDTEHQLAGMNRAERSTLTRRYVDALLGEKITPSQIKFTETQRKNFASYIEIKGLLENTVRQEETTLTLLKPLKSDSFIQLSCRSSESTDNPYFETNGELKPSALKELNQGHTLILLNVYSPNRTSLKATGKIKEVREVPAYTFGYNDSLVVQRAHDIELALLYVRKNLTGKISLYGGAHTSSAVLACYHQMPDEAFFETNFRFGMVKDVRDANFLPGGAKYGDLPGLIEGLNLPSFGK
jgi:dienelactone hydrolase